MSFIALGLCSLKMRLRSNMKSLFLFLSPSSCSQKLQDYLARFSGQYDRLVAFKPTGWTFSQQVESVKDIQPQISGKISIYGTH